MLIFCFVFIAFEYCFCLFFQFMIKYTYLYTIIFLSFICLLGFIYESRRQVFSRFSFFEELSWEDIQRERRWLETGSVFLNRCLAKAASGLLGSLWMSMIINPEDSCCFAATQSICVIRELALFYFIFLFVIAESNIFVPKLSSGRDSSHHPEIVTAERSCTLSHANWYHAHSFPLSFSSWAMMGMEW